MSIIWNKWLKPKFGDIGNIILKTLLILIFTLFYAAIRYYKYTVECDTLYPSEQERPHENYALKALYRSAAINFGIVIFNWILSIQILHRIPFVGRAFALWTWLGEFGISHAILLTLIHFILNLYSNDKSYMCSTCTKSAC